MPKNINPFAGKKVLGNNDSNKAPRRGKHGKPKGKQHLDSRFKVLVVPTNVPCYCKHSLLMTPSCCETTPVCMSAGARQKRNGSSWGLMGVVASAAAVWLFGAWQIGQNKAKKARSDASYLTQMLALPLKYTEHAQCRMDCRWRLPFLSHSLSCAHIAESVLILRMRQGSTPSMSQHPGYCHACKGHRRALATASSVRAASSGAFLRGR